MEELIEVLSAQEVSVPWFPHLNASMMQVPVKTVLAISRLRRKKKTKAIKNT